nr:hypothetical protein KPHV_19350 [Kitasatospora purpeofusca]
MCRPFVRPTAHAGRAGPVSCPGSPRAARVPSPGDPWARRWECGSGDGRSASSDGGTYQWTCAGARPGRTGASGPAFGFGFVSGLAFASGLVPGLVSGLAFGRTFG